MSDENTVAPDSGSPVDAPATGTLSTNDAYAIYARAKATPVEREEETPEAPTPKSAPAENAAPETDPGEVQEEADPAEALPPIEPPRSWSKEDKDAFNALPRATQERVAEREAKREAEFRNGQNETASQRKAIAAEQQAAAQARAQYEQALPALLSTLQAQQAGEFADIRSHEDLARLAEDDPLRFVKWQAHQQRISAVNYEMQQTQARQAQETAQNFQRFADEQNRIFLEKNPEYGKPEIMEKAQKSAAKYLTDIGFTTDELTAMWRDGRPVSLRDARVQSLIADGIKYREAKATVAVAPKPAPKPVLQPGTSASKGDAKQQEVQRLERRLAETNSRDAGYELYKARRG